MSSAASGFAATRWTLVVQARGADPASQTALSELCAAYYAPVLTFLRSEGRREDAARDLAHDFFARMLAGGSLQGADPARGRFRSYLLGAVKHFLADDRDRAHAARRGGGTETIPLDGTAAEAALPVAAAEIPGSERAFERQWALTVIARALDSVSAELAAAGKAEHYEVLKPWITGESGDHTRKTAAQQLAMSEGALKVAIHRLRQRFRDAVKEEIAQTVPAESDIDDELRYLISIIAGQ